jgi:hypothetical protein
MIEGQFAGLERADERLAHVSEFVNVAADERAPDPGVEAGQIAGELVVGDQFAVGGDQPMVDDRARTIA